MLSSTTCLTKKDMGGFRGIVQPSLTVSTRMVVSARVMSSFKYAKGDCTNGGEIEGR